ncbi:MAG: hypothetical protein OXC97_02005 [Candidatus Dadabacteria bacterium]|nr:hypothetical protein [Candidatus Dadabacteria bacterium]
MKRVIALFIVLVFVAGCGGEDGNPTGLVNSESLSESSREGGGDENSTGSVNSPDFKKIEIPTEFTQFNSTPDDAYLVPEEMVEIVIDALTVESARTEFVSRIREACFSNAFDNLTDEQIWEQVVYEFALDSRLHVSGSNLEESVRNLLAYDLSLDRVGTEEGNDLYGDTFGRGRSLVYIGCRVR